MNNGFPAARIELDRLIGGPVQWSGELVGDAEAWGLEEARLLEAPRLTFRAEAAGSGGVRVKGTIESRLGLTCRRCLRAVEESVGIEFEFRFDPTLQPWEEEEGMYRLDPETAILDLSGPLREELLLAVPKYPECPESCSGLCPRCGADLDEEDCECSGEESDPRWDVLRELVPDGQRRAAEPDDEIGGQ